MQNIRPRVRSPYKREAKTHPDPFLIFVAHTYPVCVSMQCLRYGSLILCGLLSEEAGGSQECVASWVRPIPITSSSISAEQLPMEQDPTALDLKHVDTMRGSPKRHAKTTGTKSKVHEQFKRASCGNRESERASQH